MPEVYASFEGLEITASDESIVTNIVATDSNPASVGLVAPIGTLALSTNGRWYYKHNTANTDWVTGLTQLPNEFSTILPLKGSVAPGDKVLIEDSADSFRKKEANIQNIIDLVSTSNNLPFYECFENPDLSVITSVAPITVLSGTTQSLTAGKYRVAWTYGWSSAQLLKSFIAELLIDGVVQRTHYEAVSEIHPDNEFSITCNDQRIPNTGFLVVDFPTAGTHTLEIRVRTEDLTYQVSIWEKAIEIQRVG